MRGYAVPAIVLAIFFLAGSLWALQVPSRGAVNCSALNVRTGPGLNFTIITSIPQGTQVTILDVAGKWYQISFEGSNDRYVYASYIDVTEYAEVSDDDSAKKPTSTLLSTDPKRPDSSRTDKQSVPRNDF
ncbi:MAG TPA: SH3 domain-containing protein [Candidatus Ozemobacteraceae bacterium]|nr:SH3 domain-containing protein [Candidatus Ozemobacteraceae bacterium]